MPVEMSRGAAATGVLTASCKSRTVRTRAVTSSGTVMIRRPWRVSTISSRARPITPVCPGGCLRSTFDAPHDGDRSGSRAAFTEETEETVAPPNRRAFLVLTTTALAHRESAQAESGPTSPCLPVCGGIEGAPSEPHDPRTTARIWIGLGGSVCRSSRSRRCSTVRTGLATEFHPGRGAPARIGGPEGMPLDPGGQVQQSTAQHSAVAQAGRSERLVRGVPVALSLHQFVGESDGLHHHIRSGVRFIARHVSLHEVKRPCGRMRVRTVGGRPAGGPRKPMRTPRCVFCRQRP